MVMNLMFGEVMEAKAGGNPSGFNDARCIPRVLQQNMPVLYDKGLWKGRIYL